jgi:glyoxylase-like metal-dependent hydrolase (beta-lactamase superfamily II)
VLENACPDAGSEDWDIYILEFARSHKQPLATLLYGTYDQGTVDLPFGFVLARGYERTVLIDTGFMREGNGVSFAEKFGIPYWISPLRLLAEVGVTPDKVTDIVLSHAHFDHIGSIEQFPNARLYIQKKEFLTWIEIMALPKEFSFLSMLLDPEDVHSAIHAAEEHRLLLLEGDQDNVLPRLHVRTGPGHTPGQQYIVLDTARGPYVVSGDCIFGRANLTGMKKDGVYLPLGAGIGSTWDQLKTIDRIHREVKGDLDRLIILHDFDRWRHFATVKEVEGFKISRVE